ncbi:uncharacterized protein LY89DRAFT_735565 [Mollisia scopiformis]|uniref:Uncharacterized protein n=1 Tax=Mollisia scopiformis TaxID=149040 RepID=A0A194X5V1_MOLSC|nr:uncharacterized protein LY89DRAFT_735565 [Mollisia scopiformis]KUJ15454.1 hypothetical protein LY89DRAFT_735565 [Mollisia scopiformis]
MRLSHLLTLVLQCQLIYVSALITLESIRDLTRLTDDMRARIEGSGKVSIVPGQRVLGGGEDGDEIEDVVAAALKVLCSELLRELEKPLIEPLNAEVLVDVGEQDLRCRVIRRGYHGFLEATVKFLHEVQERELRWQWDHESMVFEGVGWLQGLWASRKTNIQDRSFIEQQMMLYSETGCFGKSQEVLRSGVEVVEYLNDLLDSFP